jgi:MerR family transcriptional regulator, Zn(II)-responsive regulator of zntA
MMTVNQLSKRSGIAPHVVRYYSRIGLLAPARHPDNGYQLFSRDDAARLRFIRMAQNLGFTLEEIRHILGLSGAGESPCQEVREILRQRIEENRQRLVDFMALQRRMEQALALWEKMPDAPPHNGTVCHLIESVAETGIGA